MTVLPFRATQARRALPALAAACAAAALAATPFDGTWNVTLTCAKAPDGAFGYTFEFPATVVDGVLHGEHGVRDASSWLALDGRINADGSARLEAAGLSGAPAYVVGRPERRTPYAYEIDAHFGAATGNGSRLGVRRCDLLFVKTS